MGEYRINTAAPNLTSLCIDHVCNGEYSGRIYHKYQQEAVPFRESSQLISILDSFFDQINYPQASTKYRSFQKTKKEEAPVDTRRREKLQPVLTAEEVLANRGEEATFILHVQYRQNSTWQGKLIWLEVEQEEGFCSVLELLKLLDSALEGE
ncbi:MAG: hypothetical protein HFG50_01160 [Lachnospiraceae bacterium]|jgi:hypothetical protein|nr:hypothetical protein [Lachnospiraceae bacterium]